MILAETARRGDQDSRCAFYLPLARGIGQIKGDRLCVIIQPLFAEKLRIREGSLVVVENKNGKLMAC